MAVEVSRLTCKSIFKICFPLGVSRFKDPKGKTFAQDGGGRTILRRNATVSVLLKYTCGEWGAIISFLSSPTFRALIQCDVL